MIANSIGEFRRTAEGRELWAAALQKTANGMMAFLHGGEGSSRFFVDHHDVTLRSIDAIMIGGRDYSARYVCTDGLPRNVSIQRILFHELTHVAEGHAGIPLIDMAVPIDAPDEVLQLERDVITRTNEFMAKYYGEAPRCLLRYASDFEGTPYLEFNRNFALKQSALNRKPKMAG